MKLYILSTLLFLATLANAQSLPFDFETDITTDNFENFDGGTATVIPNPQMDGINTSATVAQIVREGGTIWSGSKILLANNLDLSTDGTFTMKVNVPTPPGTIVKLKLEGPGTPLEIDVPTTVSGEWEQLSWDFTGLPGVYNWVVFMFDFGNVGDGSENSTFWFDDVTQGPGIDLTGCTYSGACNYSSVAQEDDGSCDYSCFGCMDIEALNYNPEATVEDNSCVLNPGNDCPGDYNGDGLITAADLASFLAVFGSTCD